MKFLEKNNRGRCRRNRDNREKITGETSSFLGVTSVVAESNQLKSRARNPRTHSAKQIKQIAASIKEFGFISPVLIDGDDGIIAGHGRVEAAKLIGMSDVPTVRVDHLTPAQIRAYIIADNRLAENAGWDRALLTLELQELSVELNFDVTVTGFETAEIDLLISELNDDTRMRREGPTIDRSVPAVSRRPFLPAMVSACAAQASRAESLHICARKSATIKKSAGEILRVRRRENKNGRSRVHRVFPRILDLAMHPTVKPVALVADAILDCSKRGGIILDVFAGSGTTLIAAEKAGRRGYGIEIDCHYTDIIIRRFDETYGLKAVHAESKLDFERLTNERFKEKRHGQKAKNGKAQPQKIGNPPKHPQFGKGTAGNPLSVYLVKAARDQVFATAGGEAERFRS